MESLIVNGATIYYADQGPANGTPVVLVHGHPFNHTMWHPQAAELSRAGYRVISPDLRGYGRSAVIPGRTLLSDFASDIAAVLDHLGLERAVIGGLSMGGQIAMEFHRLHPERVLALILADTSPVAETEEGRAFRNNLADRLLAEGMDGYADEVIGRMIAPYSVTALPDVAEHVLGMMRTTAPEGAAAALRGRAERPDYRTMLTRVVVPTLIVVGADDTYTPVSEAEFMHRQIPRSTLVVIDRAAHMPNLEQPTHVNTALLQFLSAHHAALG